MYGCESWTIKKAEHQRINAFELWCWRRLLRVPWTARRSNQSILKESVLNIHWRDWCWSWNSNILATSCEELTHWKRPWCWERLKVEEKGTTEDKMVGWHNQLDGHEVEQAAGVGVGQGGLVCCSPWGRKESDTTEQLNWTEHFPYLDITISVPSTRRGRILRIEVLSGHSLIRKAALGKGNTKKIRVIKALSK